MSEENEGKWNDNDLKNTNRISTREVWDFKNESSKKLRKKT